MGESKMIRVKYEDLFQEFKRVLISRGFSAKAAEDAASVFAQNSLDGIYSHGINRFSRVVEYLDKGEIDPKVLPTTISARGAVERWDGHRGFGPLNAKMAMDRACELAKEYGIGLVALGNNNHWMRGGSYGWQAANNGCIGICWSNTMPNMPAWGAKDRKIGNNPFIYAVPKSNGEHVVVDCAVSQFSYGKIEEARLKGAAAVVANQRAAQVHHQLRAAGLADDPLPGPDERFALPPKKDSIAFESASIARFPVVFCFALCYTGPQKNGKHPLWQSNFSKTQRRKASC